MHSINVTTSSCILHTYGPLWPADKKGDGSAALDSELSPRIGLLRLEVQGMHIWDAGGIASADCIADRS